MSLPILVSFEPRGGIATLRFNRPDVLNAIDVAMARELLRNVRALAVRQDLRCLVLRGEGRVFMAGGDVASLAAGGGAGHATLDGILDALNPAILTLRSLNAPVLAAVHGVAAGAGLSLALAADLVIATDSARFLMAYDRIGAVPDCGGSWFLARKLGAGRAAELMMLGHELGAAEARAWGLVARAVPEAEFPRAVEALAERLSAGPVEAYAAFRGLLDGASAQTLAAQLEHERRAFHAAMSRPAFAEGTAAFLDKREPRFAGAASAAARPPVT